jgi:ABC-type multidrug transport system fused ATPase/permease subunit
VTIAVLMLHLAVFGVGAYLTYQEEITLGTFIAFESVFWELSYNIGHVTQFIPVAISGSGATRHINDLFNEPARNQDPAEWPGVQRMTSEHDVPECRLLLWRRRKADRGSEPDHPGRQPCRHRRPLGLGQVDRAQPADAAL